MAGTDRKTADPVALQARLAATPEAYALFDALRRIECAYPEGPRLGESARPIDDNVRLCQAPSLSFAPRDIERFEPAADGKPARLHNLVFGLFGPHGPLPLHLTEHAFERARNTRDTTLIGFANVFHHRMLSLFYRAWANAQPTVQMDRPKQDRFGMYMGALIGLSTPGLGDRDQLPDRFKRFFAGRLVQQVRDAEGLKRFLEDFFAIPFRVIEFVAEWMRLPATAYARLGRSPETAGLGRTAVLGAKVWGAQQRFRLRLGPLDQFEFNRFLPGGEALRQLVSAVRTYVGDEKAWDVQLVLKRDEVPATRLGQSGRMGLTTWMGTFRKDGADADQVVLRPMG